ncbi:hypothetical protein LCGC14_1194210 [marine sediment metagenome]|uniref:Uncharacterized protein n=1 Tax=marine sediment metagenome TaxID=412755 RepID=A0A0F9LN85_9ZZZZ
MKYNFYTGENAKKVKRKGYKYLGKGDLGFLKTIKIDGETFYYLVDDGIGFKISPYSADKSKFKKVEIEEFKYEGRGWINSERYVEKQKSKKELVFKTKIQNPKRRFMSSVEIKFGKKDHMLFFRINHSNVIRDLQLKEGDELIVKFQKKRGTKK